ncbi:MAG: hypothetical protein LBJ71_03030 [Holosporaceae bacterium]|jgi:hypothetical protein|nr:hypothetical protein [Holosporaceae bacterium]
MALLKVYNNHEIPMHRHHLVMKFLIPASALLCTGCIHREHCIDSTMHKRASNTKQRKNTGSLDPKLLAAYLVCGSDRISLGPISIASIFSPNQTQKIQFEIEPQYSLLDGIVKVLDKYDDLKGTATYNECFHLFEYIGNWGEYEIYWVLWRGGGSGTFTNIHFFKMSEGKLYSFSVGEGDRAFGGILANPIFVNGQLYYYRRLIDDDLAAAAGFNFEKTNGCATGVAAIGLFAFDPSKRDRNPEGNLVGLRLVNPRKDITSHNYSKVLYDKISKKQVIFEGKEMEVLWGELRCGK